MTRRQRLVFLRHSETDWNAAGRVMGRTDIGLNRTGVTQACAARARIAALAPTSAWVSPLRRARQTARLVLGAPARIPVTILTGLVERDWGAWEGRAAGDRPRDPGVAGAGTVEPWELFAARVAAAVGAIDDPGLPLVIAHSGVWRALLDVSGGLAAAPPDHAEARVVTLAIDGGGR